MAAAEARLRHQEQRARARGLGLLRKQRLEQRRDALANRAAAFRSSWPSARLSFC